MSAVGGPLRVATHSATACLGLPPVRPPHGRRLLAAACPGQTAPHCSGQCGRAELSFRFYTRQCNAPRAFFGLNTVTGRRAISSVVAWQGTVLRSWPIHSFISARGAASCGVCTVPQNTIRLSAPPPRTHGARLRGSGRAARGGGHRAAGPRRARRALRPARTTHAARATIATATSLQHRRNNHKNYFCNKKKGNPICQLPFFRHTHPALERPRDDGSLRAALEQP